MSGNAVAFTIVIVMFAIVTGIGFAARGTPEVARRWRWPRPGVKIFHILGSATIALRDLWSHHRHRYTTYVASRPTRDVAPAARGLVSTHGRERDGAAPSPVRAR